MLCGYPHNGKSRHVPIAASTLGALDRYLETRRQHVPHPATNALFVNVAGTRLAYPALLATFHHLVDISEISTGKQPPRIHDYADLRVMPTWWRSGCSVGSMEVRLSA